jgi:hypothetical protein
MEEKAGAIVALILVLVLTLVLTPMYAQEPVVELGTHRPDAEGVTTHSIGEIPPGAKYLGCDLGFEASDGFPGDCWYGEEMGKAFRTVFRPREGFFHLRQKDADSLVWTNIDTSACSPLHPIWVYSNVLIETNREPDVDVQEGIFFDALTGLSIATLWTRWNQQGNGEYDEIRVRVEGSGQITNHIWLVIGANFSPAELFEYTIFDTDALTVACVPLLAPPEHRIYLTTVIVG